jgi:hypothetical protein
MLLILAHPLGVYINKNTTIGKKKKKKVSSLAISTSLQNKQKNQAHGMYKRKSFGFSLFFRQCFLSHSAYDMVEEKRRKKTNME